jgi:hypothetical protein
MEISDKYRLRALECERLGREVPNAHFKSTWAALAIEWHALAARRAQEVSQDRERWNKLRRLGWFLLGAVLFPLSLVPWMV